MMYSGMNIIVDERLAQRELNRKINYTKLIFDYRVHITRLKQKMKYHKIENGHTLADSSMSWQRFVGSLKT